MIPDETGRFSDIHFKYIKIPIAKKDSHFKATKENDNANKIT
jgi:hypothetical protein